MNVAGIRAQFTRRSPVPDTGLEGLDRDSGEQSIVKAVIINADDFGARPEANAAIIRAHTEGALTSASLMVNEPVAEEAIALAREHPDLAVGLHLTVSNGIASLPRESITHITSGSGRFRETPALAGISYFFSPAARKEIRAEIRSQFDRFASTGLTWDHVNGHQHLHLHPVVWDEMIRLCERHNVKRVRIPFEEFRPRSLGRMAGRRLEWLFFRMLRSRCLRSIAGKGFTVADRVYGHIETGAVTEEYLLDLLGRVEGKTNEIYLHPGTHHAPRMAGGGAGMDFELQALLSPRVRDRICALGLVRSTYAGIGSGMTECLNGNT